MNPAAVTLKEWKEYKQRLAGHLREKFLEYNQTDLMTKWISKLKEKEESGVIFKILVHLKKHNTCIFYIRNTGRNRIRHARDFRWQEAKEGEYSDSNGIWYLQRERRRKNWVRRALDCSTVPKKGHPSWWRVLGPKLPAGRVSCQWSRPTLVLWSPSLAGSRLQEVWPQQLETSVNFAPQGKRSEQYIFF